MKGSRGISGLSELKMPRDTRRACLFRHRLGARSGSSGTQEGEWTVASRGGERDSALRNCSLYPVRKVTGTQGNEGRKAERRGFQKKG